MRSPLTVTAGSRFRNLETAVLGERQVPGIDKPLCHDDGASRQGEPSAGVASCAATLAMLLLPSPMATPSDAVLPSRRRLVTMP
jgi:hypothetical protein